MISRFHLFREISDERERQEELKASGRFSETCADAGMSPTLKLAVLTEEVGEVARCLCDGDSNARLREELVQVAAVAMAWLESLS